MRDLIKNNLLFFAGFFLLIIAGCIFLTQIETGEAVIYFQENRSIFWTHFFLWATKLGEALPFILIGLFFLFFKSIKEFLFVAIAGAVTTLVAFGLKTYFLHPRPKVFFSEKGVFELFDFPAFLQAEIHGGLNSFPSGHTMAAFSLFALTVFFHSQKKAVGLILLFLAFLVGISRMYLFQHFLKDVLFGALIGVFIAVVLFLISKKAFTKLNFPLLRKFRKMV